MDKPFEDIKLTGLDDEATRNEGGLFFRIVLRLSAHAPPQWIDAFNHYWQMHFYMLKRDAAASLTRIELHAPLAELEQHIPEINKVITEANSAYRTFAERQAELMKKDREAQNRDKELLADLKKRLKF